MDDERVKGHVSLGYRVDSTGIHTSLLQRKLPISLQTPPLAITYEMTMQVSGATAADAATTEKIRVVKRSQGWYIKQYP